MIHTSRQLKDFVRKLSKGNSLQAQIIIRNYIMERFLERLSLSQYKNNFVLKGGMLVAAMVGLDNRTTLDIDTTIKSIPLSIENCKNIIEEIIGVPIDDGVVFHVNGLSEIIDEADYAGIRVIMEATIDKMRTPLKLDISTGDMITPREIEYQFKLMFEQRTISVLAYNLETVLAEKLETIISRGTANTRMRDFYDVYIILKDCSNSIDTTILPQSFRATYEKRGSTGVILDAEEGLQKIRYSIEMRELWRKYQNKFTFASNVSWDNAMDSVIQLYNKSKGIGV